MPAGPPSEDALDTWFDWCLLGLISLLTVWGLCLNFAENQIRS